MNEYFVDAWFLIALADSSDSHHRQAKLLDRSLGGIPLLTHDAVLTEFLTYFAAGGRNSRKQASALVRNVLSRIDYRVERSSDLFSGALVLYEQRPDKEYSLVDCMSMTLMRERGITHVLTNDHHFRQEGFTVVSE